MRHNMEAGFTRPRDRLLFCWEGWSQRLEDYLEHLTRGAGHADRIVPMENYTKGLLLPLERKSAEAMAACPRADR